MGLITDYLTASTRAMTPNEVDDAKRVYMKTIPYGRVLIADDLGMDNREWTEPTGGPMDLYTIHLGPAGFASTNDAETRATLIHELCHVWQGVNHVFSWGYVINSGWSQLRHGTQGAYRVSPGKDWNEYNVEQQATLVEQWYKNGLKPSDPRYRYIINNILCPKMSWLKEIGGDIDSAIEGTAY